MESDTTILQDTNNVPNVTDNCLEKNEIETKNDVEPERATTPDQSPSTKTKLRKVCTIIIFGY